MKLRGMHAQNIETLEDALAKLASGHMTPDDLVKLQTLVSKGGSNVQAVADAQRMLSTVPSVARTTP